MKKKPVVVVNIIGLVLLALAVAAFLLGPVFFGLKGATPFYAFNEIFADPFGLVKACLKVNQSGVMGIVVLAVAAVGLILLIVHLIMFIAKKNPRSLLAWFAFLIGLAAIGAGLLAILTPGYEANYGHLYYANQISGDKLGWFGMALNVFQTNPFGYGNFRKILVLIFAIVVVALFVIGFLMMVIGLILDMVYLGKLDREAEKKALGDDVVIVNEEELDQIEEEKEEEEEEEKEGHYRPRPEPTQPLPQPAGIVGPLLVQYINTYTPTPTVDNGPKKNAVPVTEIKDAIGEKPLTAQEIRKIIQEELASKEETPAQPVIVSVPAPAPKDEEPQPGLTAEEVRQIFEEELRKAQPAEDEDIIVEEEPVPALTAEEVRAIIAEALASKEEPKEEVDVRDVIREELASFYGEKDAAEAARKAAEEEAARKAAEEAEAARKAAEEEEARRRELEEARREAAEAAKKAAEEEAARKAAEEEAARKAEEQRKNELTADDIRKIIADVLAANKPEEKPAEQPAGLTADDIREIMREELKDMAPVAEEPVVVEEKKPEPAPAPSVTVVVQQPTPAPEAAEAEKNAIERIPFPTRLLASEEDVQENYNILKNEILAYGVKSRVSNTGDTFRLHKITYVKITVAGKGLKLYFALDPKDYAESKIPVADAGHKGIYQDIPLVFKVKSDLSLRRAKQLIADVMAKFGNEKGMVEERDWAYALKDYKPAGVNDEE